MANRQPAVNKIKRFYKKYGENPKKWDKRQAGWYKDLWSELRKIDLDNQKQRKDKQAQAKFDGSEEGKLVARVKTLHAEFKTQGITGTNALTNAAQAYQSAYNNYKQNESFYKQHWKQIYGKDIGSFGFNKNPFAMAAVSSGKYMDIDLSDLALKANQLSATVKTYEKLGGAGSFENVNTLNYENLSELSGMYDQKLPTQAELARMQTDSTFKVDGKSGTDLETLYDKLRKKRKGLFTEEETKTVYQQTDDGFAAKGLKPRQKY